MIFFNSDISEATRDRAIVTIEQQQEVIGSLSNGDIFNDLLRPLTQFSRSQYLEVEYLTGVVPLAH